MKKYNNEKYIVSITSFGKRFDNACKMIYNLQKQTYKNWHLVITIYEGDVKDITPNLQLLIDNDILEVIIAPENLCPHLKYFYVMQKYKDKPIITLDDDRIYNNNVIEYLVATFEKVNYKTVISNIAPKMTKHNSILNKRSEWCTGYNRLRPNEVSYIAMPEGFGGVLYPPNCFDKLENEINDIKKILYDDDVFLKVLEIKNKIPVTQSGFWETVNNKNGYDIPETQIYKMANTKNAGMEYRDNVTKIFNDDLIKGFNL